MKRTLAQMVRWRGHIRRLCVVIEADDRIIAVEPFCCETESTLFFNGLIADVPHGVDVPQMIRADEAESVAARLPEPHSGESSTIVKIQFM